ncbi:hypothetical protein C8Q77DRAFT_271819 [Trametes polyzona]|nr:hypothetical protein C8Q77DRAFT_271819 [Trametes polyzona]
MPSVSHEPAMALCQPIPLDALQGIIESITSQRLSMSIEMLRSIQGSLLTAQSLVQEAINAHCAVDRLPPELLSHIFSFVPGVLPSYGTLGCRNARQTYDLVSITHVCRRWRAIALNTSSLWSTLCLTSGAQHATGALRERARNTPLTVYSDGSQASYQLLDVLRGDADRIAELHIHSLLATHPLELARVILQFPATRLQHATIWVLAKYDNDRDAQIPPIVELWKGEAPRLQTLQLHDLPFLPSNHFQSLQKMALSWEKNAVAWGVAELLAVLENAPNVEYVSLHGLPSDLHLRRPFQPSSRPSIALPRLQVLEVGKCRGQACSAPLLRLILSQIDFPAGASIRLSGLSARDLSGPLNLACSVFPESTEDSQARLTIDMTYQALTLSMTDLHTSIELRVEVNTGGASTLALQQATTTFASQPLATSVRELIVRSQRAWSVWCEPEELLARSFPRVTTLGLHDAHLIPRAIDALRPTHVDGGTTVVPCTGLSTLRLPPLLSSELVERLACVLKDRAKYGVRLRQVISNHSISQVLLDVDGI